MISENRKKEEQAMNKCVNTHPNDNIYIAKLINKTITTGHKVYLGSDWHLWKRDKDNRKIVKKIHDFDEIIDHYKTTVKPKDLFIFLGDLVDSEFQQPELLREVLLELPGQKLMVLGNNDIFDYEFYRSCGFRYVKHSFIANNILFSHDPLNHENTIMNIHGHIHNSKTYWIPYNQHIDVLFKATFKLNELLNVISNLTEYKKLIRDVSDKHMQETYIFDEVMTDNKITDPYDDFMIDED